MPKQRGTELLDLVAVPLAKLLGKVAAIADLDDTLLWVLSQIERGKVSVTVMDLPWRGGMNIISRLVFPL